MEIDTQSMQEIVNQLNQWAYEYYVLDKPSVNDTTYDALYDRLVFMENNTGKILPDSPTHRIGGQPLDKFKKYTHKKQLYSLDKVQSFNELEQWIKKIQDNYGEEVEFTVEYKYDGLNLSLTYDNGLLINAATRGNGTIGEIVTSQVMTIRNVPLRIPYLNYIEIQGEGYLKKSSMKKYNEEHPYESLKNERNGVAGAIRNLDPKVTAQRNLDMVFYSLGYNELNNINSQSDLVEFFHSQGMKTNDLFKTAKSYKEIKNIIENAALNRPQLDYLIDGIVIKVNDFSIRNNIGYTEKFPKWAVAFKFEAEEVITKLLDVEWNVGRTGKITPIGHLEPVELCGATIKRATLNNLGDIHKKRLKSNSYVFIRRSNDVIPEILGNAEDTNESQDIVPPINCPSCNTHLINRGAHLYCPNDSGCMPQIVQRILHYCEKNACNIVGISDKTIVQMFKILGVNSVDKLYELSESDLKKLDGFKDKKIFNTLNSINASKNVKLPNFIYALGIDNVGYKTSKDIADKFKCVSNLKNASFEDLISVSDIGNTTAESIMEYFSDNENLKVINKLKEYGIDPQYQQIDGNKLFNSMNFVITGTLKNMSRYEAQKIIEDNGGKTSETVSNKTDVVVVGENPGSKYNKAKLLGKTIWEEDDFVNNINNMK